jgi:hypothetical protein
MTAKSTIKKTLFWKVTQYVAILYLIFYVLESQFFGTYYTAFLWGAFLIFIGIYYFIKVEMYQFLLIGFLFGTAVWHYEIAFHLKFFLIPLTFIFHLLLAFIVAIILMPRMTKAYKLEAHARSLFKLASQQVFEVANGFTNRPFSGINTNASKQDIIGLARFLEGKEILIFDKSPDLTTFAFSMNTSPLVDPLLSKVSYVSIDNDGKISVHISERDYNQYKEKFSFDQLCASFANLFKQFLAYYISGSEERILTELKSV